MATTTNLFTPLKLGGVNLANRIVMAPLTRSRAGISRMPNDFMREYYELRSSAGLIISEATAISDQGYGWYGAPALYTEEHAKAWKPIVSAVHNRGGKMFCQLWHMGRRSHSSFHSEVKEIVAPSAIRNPDGYLHDANRNRATPEIPRALEMKEILKIVFDFQKGADLAKKAGFDGVEIHSANGYLIDTFIQSTSNHRHDQYGGSFENRFRFLREIIEAIQDIYPSNQIGVRFSPNAAFAGMGSNDNDQIFPFIAKQLSKYDLAYIHILDGLWRGFHNQCKPVTVFDMKKNFEGNIIGNAEYTKELANGALRTGAVDAIAFGRPFLSNPDLVERFRQDWPLNAVTPTEQLYGWTPDPKDCLEGYLSYPLYSPPPKV